MEDSAIVKLYWDRSETAISETAVKYGSFCYSIAYNILTNNEDAQECVSDTYLAAWNAIPPKEPQILSAFLAKITRYISLNRWKSRRRTKRGGGEPALALEELGECAGSENVENVYARKEMVRSVNRFLEGLSETERNVFLRRYWGMDSIRDISESFGFSESKTASILHRTRGKLRKMLEKEGLL